MGIGIGQRLSSWDVKREDSKGSYLNRMNQLKDKEKNYWEKDTQKWNIRDWVN